MFLSADTGGGHRASAESLAKQFELYYPGSQIELLDIWTTDGCYPYKTLVPSYKHLSAHPNQWRVLYHLSNSKPWEVACDLHTQWSCGQKVKDRLESYKPDVVISVHPAMNYVPIRALRQIGEETGKHVPFFTVVTDLGSGHCTWFHRDIDRMYLASPRMKKLARRRGSTPDEKIVMSGLPIRHDFAVQSNQLGDRTTAVGREYMSGMKTKLGIDTERPMILVMGGGEGVGMNALVDELYTSLCKRGIDAVICVVCGRNVNLQKELKQKNWDQVAKREQRTRKRSIIPGFGMRKSREIMRNVKSRPLPSREANVSVIGLGFITNMADYMVAAEILVTKAGPGTIAEAAAVGLPVMLQSFLPGQEAGNVDFVIENGFGDFCPDPVVMAEEVASWLQDPVKLAELSHQARLAGRPDAASEIVIDIGSRTHAWMALNGAEGSTETDSSLP